MNVKKNHRFNLRGLNYQWKCIRSLRLVLAGCVEKKLLIGNGSTKCRPLTMSRNSLHAFLIPLK